VLECSFNIGFVLRSVDDQLPGAEQQSDNIEATYCVMFSATR
jgi:hypothetical protein